MSQFEFIFKNFFQSCPQTLSQPKSFRYTPTKTQFRLETSLSSDGRNSSAPAPVCGWCLDLPLCSTPVSVPRGYVCMPRCRLWLCWSLSVTLPLFYVLHAPIGHWLDHSLTTRLTGGRFLCVYFSVHIWLSDTWTRQTDVDFALNYDKLVDAVRCFSLPFLILADSVTNSALKCGFLSFHSPTKIFPFWQKKCLCSSLFPTTAMIFRRHLNATVTLAHILVVK